MGFPVGGDGSPRAGVIARRRPAPDHEIAVAQDQVDVPVDIRERSSEVERDLGLAGRAGFRGARAQVVADVLVVEDLVADVRVALCPDLLVEPADQGLVLVDTHSLTPMDSADADQRRAAAGIKESDIAVRLEGPRTLA